MKFNKDDSVMPLVGRKSRRAQRLAICNRDSAPDLSRAVNVASIHIF